MYNNLKHTFYEDSRKLSERSLNIHMSRVNFDKQYVKIPMRQKCVWYVFINGTVIVMLLSFN